MSYISRTELNFAEVRTVILCVFATFLTLKLEGLVAWSWWTVFSPFLIPIGSMAVAITLWYMYDLSRFVIRKIKGEKNKTIEDILG